MGSYTREQKELMKLFKCMIDTGNEVLSAFFDLKVLSKPKYGGNFNQFLELEKHFLYHQWEPKKTFSCECPKIGCTIRRISKMKSWIFRKLYESNGLEDPTHVIKHGGCIQQLCLHKYVAKNIHVHMLDISVLSYLLRIMASMSTSEQSSLNIVSDCRSFICHAWSSKCFQMTELNKLWIDLETHLLNLSEVRYRRIIQKQIQTFRKLEVDKEELAELSNHINYLKEVVEDFSSNLNNNHKEVTEFVKGFEKLSKHESDLIQKSVADQSRAIKHTQEAVEKMGVQLVTNNAEIIKMRESQEELIQMFNKVRVEMKYDKPGKTNISNKMTEECAVLWHLKTPKEWNENAVADTLRDFEKLEDKQDFKIKFVREGSLIILTTVPYGILHDKIKYEDAIKKFLTRMMNVCSINTEAACDVEATLHILENDEVSIQHSYVLCEDKSTQISIPQEDKCFQVNSYDWCDLTYEKSQKDVKPKLHTNRNIEDDSLGRGRSYRRGLFYHSSSSNVSLNLTSPEDDRFPKLDRVVWSDIGWNGTPRRSSSVCSHRSHDSSYGSRKSSLSGSLSSLETINHRNLPKAKYTKDVRLSRKERKRSLKDNKSLSRTNSACDTSLRRSSSVCSRRPHDSPYLSRRYSFAGNFSSQELRARLNLPMAKDTKEVSLPMKERKKSLKDRICSIQ